MRFPQCLLAVFALLPFISGCVQAERFLVARYDANRDELHCLHCYMNITWGKDSEFQYLQSLWRNRNYLIPYAPAPFGGIEIFGLGAWVAAGGQNVYSIALGEPGPQSGPAKAPFDLKEITVKPGTFFKSPDGGLSAYQYTIHSGKALDGMLAWQADITAGHFREGALKERQRRQKGGKPVLWTVLRPRLLDSHLPHRDPPAKNSQKPEDQPDPFLALDNISLEKLAKVKPADLALRRKGLILTFHLPLTETDAGEITRIPRDLEKLLDQEVKAGRLDKAAWQNRRQELAGVQFRLRKGRFQGEIQLSPYFPSVDQVRRQVRDLGFQAPKGIQRFVDPARQAGLPIDPKITFDGLLEAFESGNVPVRPAMDKIKPGTGLFSR